MYPIKLKPILKQHIWGGDALLEIKKGDTKYYELAGTDYTGFHNARKRLEDQNAGKFSLGWSEDKKYFMITRNE